jgi:hypothetical protein
MMAVFWDYFQHGFDILISPDNLVSKIILHSNIVCPVHFHMRRNADDQPGTPAFQTHARCPWSLPTPSGSLDHTSPLSSYKAHFNRETPEKEGISLKVPEPKKKGKKGSPGPSSLNDGGILENVKAIKEGMGKKEDSEGMILDRVVEGGLEGVEGMSPSRTFTIFAILTIGLIGYEGLILEEDMASGGISSVLIFRQT